MLLVNFVCELSLSKNYTLLSFLFPLSARVIISYELIKQNSLLEFRVVITHSRVQ